MTALRGRSPWGERPPHAGPGAHRGRGPLSRWAAWPCARRSPCASSSPPTWGVTCPLRPWADPAMRPRPKCQLTRWPPPLPDASLPHAGHGPCCGSLVSDSPLGPRGGRRHLILSPPDSLLWTRPPRGHALSPGTPHGLLRGPGRQLALLGSKVPSPPASVCRTQWLRPPQQRSLKPG